jgi:hypothetical protein
MLSEATAAETLLAEAEAALMDLAGPAMGVGQLNRLLTVRLEVHRLDQALGESDDAETAVARTRALEALDALREALGLPELPQPSEH